jgi:dTDP-4-dehydrorhamnose reductase
MGVKRALAWAGRVGACHFIFTSSTGVYRQDDGSVVTEASEVGGTPTADAMLAGERAVLESGARVVVARVSWVFGPDRPAFPDQLIERARREETCAAIGDKWSTPCYSVDLAEQVERLLGMEDVEGVFNLGNTGECTWQEYGQAALDLVAEMGVELRCRTVGAQTLAEMTGFLAPRPVHTAMDLAKLRALGIEARPWREALREYVRTYYVAGGQSAE